MKTYNETRTQEIENPDLEKGYLKEERLFIKRHEAQPEIQEQNDYITIAEYANGGKDVEKVVDVPYQMATDAWDEYENIKVYVPYTSAELLEIEKNKLRQWRTECFNIIDRATWFASLSESEQEEVKEFRLKLLDITDTMTKPDIPDCVV